MPKAVDKKIKPVKIKDAIALSKNLEEKVSIKAKAVKDRFPVGVFSRSKNEKFEVTEINEIKGGVEMFVRAWGEKDKQIGFGEDGSVDIERFRFFNPPVYVEDPNGDIVVETVDEETGVRRTKKFREDPEEALKIALTKVVSKMKNKKLESTKIV